MSLRLQKRKAKAQQQIPERLPVAEVDTGVTGLVDKTGQAMQQSTLRHVAIAVMGPEAKSMLLKHFAEDSFEEVKARVFKYVVHVKRHLL